MTLKEKTRLLRGRRIVRIEWHSFRTGRGTDRSTDPVFHLDDGTRVRFVTDETEIGEYGVCVCVYPKQEGT